MGIPVISAKVLNWSAAEIRYVSSVIKAAFLLFYKVILAANFAIVVVLSTPVGPTKNTKVACP